MCAIGLGLVALLASGQDAQARPDTTRMACAQAYSLVNRSGAIVLSTGGHTFDRFVRHRGYCTQTENIEPAFVRTRNNRQCFVGYTCEEKTEEFPDQFGMR